MVDHDHDIFADFRNHRIEHDEINECKRMIGNHEQPPISRNALAVTQAEDDAEIEIVAYLFDQIGKGKPLGL